MPSLQTLAVPLGDTPERRPLRVLACTVGGAEERIAAILAGESLHFAFTMDDALRALTHVDFDLVLIGMLFDESRGLELMRRIRANTSFAPVPIVGLRGAKIRRPVPPATFDLPMRSLGAVEVIDLAALADDEAGNRCVREKLLACGRRGA